MKRLDGRASNQLRHITFETEFTRWAEGSVLVSFGETKVLCNVTIENNLPGWLKNRENPHGWLTAEYAMLPRATHSRTRREQRWPKGRTQEISRLIGRSLRMALDLKLLGERMMIVDCDVLQADGGTRTAAITGGWVAVKQALQPLILSGQLEKEVIRNQIAAISVGMVNGMALLDLAYSEDVSAAVDFNVVMTNNEEIVEIQGTAEQEPFSKTELEKLMALASGGIQQLVNYQNQIIPA